MSRIGLSSFDRLAIAAGGVAGATTRWALGRAFSSPPKVDGGWFAYAPNTSVAQPFAIEMWGIRWDTVVANLAGCLLLGAVATLLARSPGTDRRRLLLALGTGFCGALTTFATFAVEAAVIMRAARPGAYTLPSGVDPPTLTRAIAYLAVSLIGGGLAFWFGRLAARQVGRP